MACVLTYRVSPSFERSYSLSIEFGVANSGVEESLVEHIEINLEGPRQAVTPAFSVGSREYGLARAILDELQALKLCPVPEFCDGLDGVQYDLEISAGAHHSLYSWWCELPPGWAGLAPAVALLETLVHHCRDGG
ncbi:MAG: hypothetical protein J4A00_09620 [Gammaproteobacteria bacterium]|nr:hypothetical protein [Gammaproteobacteria bacterium]